MIDDRRALETAYIFMHKHTGLRRYQTYPCSSFGTRSACTTCGRRAGYTDAPVHTRRPRQVSIGVHGVLWRGFGVWQESCLNRLADGHLDAQLQSEAGEV